MLLIWSLLTSLFTLLTPPPILLPTAVQHSARTQRLKNPKLTGLQLSTRTNFPNKTREAVSTGKIWTVLKLLGKLEITFKYQDSFNNEFFQTIWTNLNLSRPSYKGQCNSFSVKHAKTFRTRRNLQCYPVFLPLPDPSSPFMSLNRQTQNFAPFLKLLLIDQNCPNTKSLLMQILAPDQSC